MTDATRNLLEQHFDTAFAAPDGIARLRELILTLAMQGKLVEQDPNDPPASELLKEIEAEKWRLSSSSSPRRRGSSKSLPAIKPEEVPYELPQEWEWVRLGEIVEILDSLRKPVTKQDREPGPYPYYGASGIVDYVSNYIFDEPLVLVGEDGAKWGKGDNTAFSISGKTWVNNHAHVIKPDRSVLNDGFLIYCLVGMDLQPYITGMTVPKLNQARLVSILVPLPPIPEQHRIVARIDQLMARCDALEKLRKAREEKRLAVHAAAIKQLLDAPNGSAWDFIQQNFGELYTVKENVAELRKAILQLAVMGRLVPQNPNAPSASALLKEIEAEKQRLVKAGKIKKPKPLPPIKPEEVPYELPQGWEWVKIRKICHDWGQKTPDAMFTYIDVGAIDNKLGTISSNTQILDASDAPSRARKIVKPGTVIYSTVRPYLLNIAIVEKEYEPEPIASTAFAILHPFASLSARFIYHYLRSPAFIRYVESTQKGVAYPAINDGDFFSGLFPLPPLPEQHRIVARIDQLMALCDTLDQQIDAATGKQTALLDAVMAQV